MVPKNGILSWSVNGTLKGYSWDWYSVWDKNTVLYGKGYITDKLCGLQFRISPSSFYQVNSRQTEILYNEAIKGAKLNKNEVLLDAYCGTGTIGLAASKHVKKVIGVESNASAIKDANINLKINGIDNTEFVLEDAGKYMEYLSKNRIHIDTVIMDPPRAGADMRFMSSMVKLNPDKIVYVSCNPITLKDNLKYEDNIIILKKKDLRTELGIEYKENLRREVLNKANVKQFIKENNINPNGQTIIFKSKN